MEDHDDNIFDDDDALDFIMSEEVEDWDSDKQPKRQAGCLGFVVLLLVPIGVIVLL
jgi:hypothetical protein